MDTLPVDPARTQPNHAVATLSQHGIMRHQHQRHATLGMFAEQQARDLLAGGLVKIPGGFVSHQSRGIGRKRSRATPHGSTATRRPGSSAARSCETTAGRSRKRTAARVIGPERG